MPLIILVIYAINFVQNIRQTAYQFGLTIWFGLINLYFFFANIILFDV